MTTLASEYDIQARNFLDKAKAKIETKFLYYGPYFDDDKEFRDVYEITLTRKWPEPNPRKEKHQTWIFKFGQSLANSSGYVEKAVEMRRGRGEPAQAISRYHKGAVRPPSDYSVLAAIQKSDPGTFTNFCAEFGYDEDSRKAEKTYFAVQEEWRNVARIFGDVLEQLQEIQ